MFVFFVKSILNKKIQSLKPDLIVADSVHPLGALSGLVYSILKKCPLIYQIRDIWPLALNLEKKLSKNNPIYFIFEIIQNACIKKCTFVVSSLKNYKTFLREKKTHKKVVWIPNPIKKCVYKQIKSKPSVVLYIGGFGFSHDVATVLRGIQTFQKKYNDASNFIFVGDGVNRRFAESYVTKNNLKNIFFYDYRRKALLNQILSKCHIGIAALYNNPIYKYGVNLNKINSYFSFSLPVILSGGPRNNEIRSKKIGSLIPTRNPFVLAKKINHYLNMSPQKYNRMAKKIFQYASNTRGLKFLQKKLLFHINLIFKEG